MKPTQLRLGCRKKRCQETFSGYPPSRPYQNEAQVTQRMGREMLEGARARLSSDGKNIADVSKFASSTKCCLIAPAQSKAKARGPRESPCNNTAPHQIRANRKLDKSQQARLPLSKGSADVQRYSIGEDFWALFILENTLLPFLTALHTPGALILAAGTDGWVFSPGPLQVGQCMETIKTGRKDR